MTLLHMYKTFIIECRVQYTPRVTRRVCSTPTIRYNELTPEQLAEVWMV